MLRDRALLIFIIAGIPPVFFWKRGDYIYRPANIRSMDYIYTLLKFVIGGSVMVGVTFLADQVDPRYGGMLAAAPMITTLAFIFTYSEAGREITRQLIISAFWFMIPLLLFLLALYFMMYRFSLPASIGGAYGIWIAAALIVNQLLSGG